MTSVSGNVQYSEHRPTDVRSYEQLEGAVGRSAFYRPRRYRGSELLSRAANPKVRIGSHDYRMIDLSTNGVFLLAGSHASDSSWTLAQEVDARLVIHNQEVQRADATVVRVEPGVGSTRVALSLKHGYFDLDVLRRVDAEKRLSHELAVGPEQQIAALPAAFRDAVARAVHFVQFYRRSLSAHELGGNERAMNELAARIYPTLLAQYKPIREAAAAASLPLFEDPALLATAKSYVETVLTPLLMPAPIVERAYTKPLGYPGDYLVMQKCYDNGFEGDTVFAKVFHKVFVQHPMSASLITRKNYMVEQMQREHALLLAEQPQAEFRVTSVGCGPAREVAEYISTSGGWSGSAHWRLFDQEERTLELAHNSVQRSIAASGSRGHVQCLNLSFGQLIKNRAVLEHGGAQHLVYSTGLFDYLAPRTAQSLIAALYAGLAPGGKLLIGNAAGENQHFFCPTFILDWTLIYRTREEMYALAARLPGSAELHVEHEAGGAYWFLGIRKPR